MKINQHSCLHKYNVNIHKAYNIKFVFIMIYTFTNTCIAENVQNYLLIIYPVIHPVFILYLSVYLSRYNLVQISLSL